MDSHAQEPGDKRREISPSQIGEIVNIYMGNHENGRAKAFTSTEFVYRKITVEGPLRLNFQVNKERLARLAEQNAFQALAQSKKKGYRQAEIGNPDECRVYFIR